MFKLQVVLVPPSARNSLLPYGLGSGAAESSQLFGMSPLANARNPDSTLPYAPSCNASGILVHHFTTRMRKFLHFTRSTNTLLELSTEIVEKCNKMYPYVDELEILSLQDSQGCDLDPDFLVKDVFTMDNVVRAIIKKELEIEDSSPVSSYRGAKRKKLNNGFVQNTGPTGVLNIAKKRSAAFAMRNPPASNNGSNNNSVSNNMRVSTPLANQIYPPPSSEGRIDSNNSEYEYEGEQAERSFLPPPAQPQSPPIRVSSGIDHTKKIKSIVEDDAVSRSETVDPDKLRQQRLLSGSPVRSTVTPNRVTLTGQRVVSEKQPTYLNNPHSTRQSSLAARITSGRLNIPEPKISEIEKELKEGPSSPSSVLPPKPDRIPMKRPLEEVEIRKTEEDLNADEVESDESEKKVRQIIQRQTSIADNNGSPTKNGPLSEENVQLAELPVMSSRPRRERRTSLEDKVENKYLNGRSLADDERLRISNFSEDEDDGVQEKERDRQLEGQLDKGNRQLKSENLEINDDSDNESANDTVVVRDTRTRFTGNHSINKEDLLRFMEGDPSPSWDEESPSRKKPYTTVLHKDIDNSKPDPRNILPEKMTRDAARRATQLLAGRKDENSESSSESEEEEIEEPSSADHSSGTDSSMEEDNDRVRITRNILMRTLNIHPLKETVVKTDLKHDQHSGLGMHEGTANPSSRQNGQLTENHVPGKPEKKVQQSDSQLDISKPTSSPKGSSGSPTKELTATEFSQENTTLNQLKSQLSDSKVKSHKSSSSSLPANNSSEANRLESISSLIREKTRGSNSEEAKNLKQYSGSAASKPEQTAVKDSNNEDPGAKKKLQKEEKLKLKRREAENKKKETELKKKRQKEELERLKKQQFKRQQEELERKRKEFYEKKNREDLERREREKRTKEFYEKKQEDLERQNRQEEESRRKLADQVKRGSESLEIQGQEELKSRRQKEVEKKKPEEEGKKREDGKREENERKHQENESETKKQQNEAEDRRKRGELEKKRQLDIEKKQQEENERKERQKELEGEQREELQGKKQLDLDRKKRDSGDKLIGRSTISKPARAKSPAIMNGSDKLKELKARFTSPKSYVPTAKNPLETNNNNDGDEESDSLDEESSTEYSSSSSDDEDEANSKKSRRMIVDTPKGYLTGNKQRPVPKKDISKTSIEAAPQSTQRSNASNQSSQNETPISQFFHSPEKAQSRKNSSILDGLPKKIRPSLSSLSDLASRGVPEVREKIASLSPAPRISKVLPKTAESDSGDDESDGNDGSDTESGDSDSDSGDSDSSDSGFISAKSAGIALGKKKKSDGGFASLLKDSQKR